MSHPSIKLSHAFPISWGKTHPQPTGTLGQEDPAGGSGSEGMHPEAVSAQQSMLFLSVYFLGGWLWWERAKRPWRSLRRQTPPSPSPSCHSLVTFHSSRLQLHSPEPALYSTEAPVTLHAPTSVSPGLAKCTSQTPLNQNPLLQYGTFLQIPNVVYVSF